jgi:hypothetical protein
MSPENTITPRSSGDLDKLTPGYGPAAFKDRDVLFKKEAEDSNLFLQKLLLLGRLEEGESGEIIGETHTSFVETLACAAKGSFAIGSVLFFRGSRRDESSGPPIWPLILCVAVMAGEARSGTVLHEVEVLVVTG